MKADKWKLIRRCVEDGVASGWHRAHKHTDEPSDERVRECIEEAVMNEIGEWFQFGEDTE